MPVTRASDPVFTLKRNPYYVGVDPAGNQLPYIDEVRFTYFADAQALNLAAIAGNFDMQERHISLSKLPVVLDNQQKGGYKVHLDLALHGSDTTLFIKNGPCMAGLGLGGEGYLSYSIATTTGEGISNPATFTRTRRCVMVDNLRIY